MLVGVLKEIKNYEYCVGLMLVVVKEFVSYGYSVLVEMNVGDVIGFINEMYVEVGVVIVLMVE